MRSETEIIERLRAITKLPEGSRVTLGIGDDCAIYSPEGSLEDLLFTIDLFIEGVHFLRETHEAAQIGRNALARSLSDVAAMGGLPRFCLVSLCVPTWAESRWATDFFDSLGALAASTGTVVIGGDLSRSEKCICDVMVCGAVPRGKALRRDGAKAHDAIYVSGNLGGSAQGLESRKGEAWQRHLNPEPRLGLGVFLRDHLRATAAIDISDGLSLDLRRLCLASDLAAEISDPPRFPGATVERALHGGEEYELLFTVRPGVEPPESFEGVPLTRIGTIIEGPAGEVRHNGSVLPPMGFDHFRK
ncbi:MAG TPA: thiamine-phosphate kinase [Bryobacteraceae bacterium]|nr:thiamine-phosphate kinase [Bryobacteraceae bacterium]